MYKERASSTMAAPVAVKIYPIINTIQKMVLYETRAVSVPSRFYVVGSNNTETQFHVLKIDRTEPRGLHITEDKAVYNKDEIGDLLLMIDVGNQTKPGQKQTAASSGLCVACCAFGIVGFVKFLEGYYIILITKRRKVGIIGHHTVYKIEDTSMIYIPNESVRQTDPEESRYSKTFQTVDLSSNFYFSYSYDLTHSLQYNCTPPRDTDRLAPQASSLPADAIHLAQGELEEATNFIEGNDKAEATDLVYGVKNSPSYKYVWNSFLLEEFEHKVHYDWVLHLIHGFVGQSMVNVFGRHLYLTLIARRSNRFAGTRFLKRGTNGSGEVANDVETEQILHDASVQSFHDGHFTSYTQLRGSIPAFWSQDITNMVPKPPITLDLVDPYLSSAGKHFNSLLKRYGSPVIVFNLVKKKEKRRHESILQQEIVSTLSYLNQFLPSQHSLQYVGFDMARVSKSKNIDVMTRLAEIAEMCLQKTGFFQNRQRLYINELSNYRSAGVSSTLGDGKSCVKQTGVVRTNCVDCLDRTNTAQFVLGKYALAHQLYAMGVIETPKLQFETDVVRMLEWLYEDQGDTLALQYGGSQLVRRIQTYRKASPWITSQSRDIMQTLSRYYSNTFSDADKQSAINLFLGVYRPEKGKPNLWDLPTEYYLHHPEAMGITQCHRRSYSDWWDVRLLKSLPLPYDEEFKEVAEKKLRAIRVGKADRRIDSYLEYYQPHQLTVFDELWSLTLARESVPSTAVRENYSPFAQRDSRLRDTSSGKVTVVTSSTASNSSDTATSSDETSTCSDEEEQDWLNLTIQQDCASSNYFSFKDHFTSMKSRYGVEIKNPEKVDISLYKRYVGIGDNACQPAVKEGEQLSQESRNAQSKVTTLIRKSAFSLDSSRHVTPPTVNRQARDIYRIYVARGKTGAQVPSRGTTALYEQYCRSYRGATVMKDR
ncbi:PREDICTED: polyphosphoinositide phosphatase-like isoform X2 [Priapulus caudatus]|uniref:Polyphosphoinositide phosphatase-like isoform X2 n=1 Tax=Priapulus caudatus TaxID=37621 RepID=A0ABM1EEK7_PRICU|nr:PREDICTED: polyphosphoinositide phosphatase-like isoform X2 [Priapulus caudatus]